LTLTGGSGSNVLNVEGALQISGGSVSAGGGYCGVYAKNGLTVSGAANLTANATETNGYGIETYDGNVVISTTGTVSAGGTGTGFAVNARKSGFLANGLFSVSGGTVTLTNSDNPANLISGGLNHTGGTLNGYAFGAFPGGNVTIAGNLAGGNYAGNGKGASRSLDYYDHSTYAYASGNALTVTSGNFTGSPSFSGGHSNRAGEHANGNSITVSGGDFSSPSWINGGQLDNNTGGGEANNNIVVVTNFTGTVTTVTGGNGKGSASGNTVTISGGGNVGYVYGGSCGSGNATGNTVTLTGGTFTTNIYGAFAGAGYDATGNTVTIEAGATIDADVTLYGGSSSSGNAVTGNILNLKKSGVAIRMLGNFAEYNFTLPASIAAGSTVITASDGYNGMSAIDVAGSTVSLAFDGAPSLAVGNKITLIDGGTNGVTGAPATASLTASGYTFGIAVENDKLVAAVTAVPGGGSGTGTGGSGSSGGGSSTPSTPATPAPGGSTVTTPDGKPPVQNPDGSATLPGGGTVTVGGQDGSTSAGAPTVTITAPAGTVIGADGGVTIPANESATVTITPQGAASGSDAAMTVAVPGGTSIDKDGNIAVPAGKEAEISLPESKAEVTAPGGTTITAGGTVTVGNGTANIALPGGTAVSVPAGSTIRPDGTVSIGTGGATVHIAIRTRVGSRADAAVPLAAEPGSAAGLTLKLAANTVIVLDEASPLGYSVKFGNPFGDVSASGWFYGDAAFVHTHGLFKGASATEFLPNAFMTRGMLVTVLHRLADEPEADGKDAFGDVESGKYYAEAVAWAAEARIINGYGGGLFGPEDSITRQDLAVILVRYAELAGLELTATRGGDGFADGEDISGYAAAAVEVCRSAGMISGKPGNLFDPKAFATRAEVAALLHRLVLAAA
ncbi:MAG: S-layer homology domain-containing protein, partial [Oscillospiraceae bacterium]|jgi:hypothetical protein|nr:S-layer homology domain-containing protein [Oscillospiraceae bacterium]